jgi:hypothetical protein
MNDSTEIGFDATMVKWAGGPDGPSTSAIVPRHTPPRSSVTVVVGTPVSGRVESEVSVVPSSAATARTQIAVDGACIGIRRSSTAKLLPQEPTGPAPGLPTGNPNTRASS